MAGASRSGRGERVAERMRQLAEHMQLAGRTAMAALEKGMAVASTRVAGASTMKPPAAEPGRTGFGSPPVGSDPGLGESDHRLEVKRERLARRAAIKVDRLTIRNAGGG